MITVLAGGVGAARFLSGLLRVVDPAEICAIVNVGDDVELHGLYICPDLDTVTYTLAGAIDPTRGWGLADESWKALDMVRRYGGVGWFNLGDRDLGTHLYRTQRRAEGAPLSTITAEIAATWELGLRMLPVTDDRVETRVVVDAADVPAGDNAGAGEASAGANDGDGTVEIGFQEYFVRLRHSVAVRALRFVGRSRRTPGARRA